ncbi:MAG: redoxin family protein [Bacteroidia bacterium]|nr:redoxin family protein [Bacteroidia bacterium]
MWKTIALTLLTFLFLNSSLAQIKVPAFSFKTLDGKDFTQSELKTDRPTMIMNYDPYCDHCNEQAETIKKAASKFKEKNVQFVFVTFIPEKEATEEFIKNHFEGTGLDYTFLLDPEIRFESYFGYTDDALNIFLYKAKGGKPKYFGEEQSAETILNNLVN